MLQARRGTALWGIVVFALALWAGACETTRNLGGIQRDTQEPSILLTNTAGDTQPIANGLQFGVSAIDNLALKEIRLTFTGGYGAVADTVFIGTVKTYTKPWTITFPSTSAAGGFIT